MHDENNLSFSIEIRHWCPWNSCRVFFIEKNSMGKGMGRCLCFTSFLVWFFKLLFTYYSFTNYSSVFCSLGLITSLVYFGGKSEMKCMVIITGQRGIFFSRHDLWRHTVSLVWAVLWLGFWCFLFVLFLFCFSFVCSFVSEVLWEVTVCKTF